MVAPTYLHAPYGAILMDIPYIVGLHTTLIRIYLGSSPACNQGVISTSLRSINPASRDKMLHHQRVLHALPELDEGHCLARQAALVVCMKVKTVAGWKGPLGREVAVVRLGNGGSAVLELQLSCCMHQWTCIQNMGCDEASWSTPTRPVQALAQSCMCRPLRPAGVICESFVGRPTQSVTSHRWHSPRWSSRLVCRWQQLEVAPLEQEAASSGP